MPKHCMEALLAMRWTRIRWFCGVACGVLAGASLAPFGAKAQSPLATPHSLATPQTSIPGELQSLASRAALVFSGQVVSITRHGGVVEVCFRVEQRLFGAVGATYTLREWAGLWPAGQSRYTVGLRALVFLHGASAAGFASPVGGAEGVLPVLVQGADAPALVDVRRLAASIERPVGTPLLSEAQGAIQFADAVEVVAAATTGTTSSSFKPILRPFPVHGLPVQAPLPLLPATQVQVMNPVQRPVSVQRNREEMPYVAR